MTGASARHRHMTKNIIPFARAQRSVKEVVEKFYQDVCLMEQHFVKDPELTIEQLLNGLIAKTGEKIQIRRFARFQVGEGMEA